MRTWTIVFLMATAVGCGNETNGKAGCTENGQCASGEVCFEGSCARVCTDDRHCGANDCDSGFICQAGVCRPGCRADAPVIGELDADGSVTAVSGAVNGTAIAHRIETSIAIRGENLEGAEVTWTPPGGAELSLELTSASDTEVVATLPSVTVTGEHLLTVTNAVGSDQASVWTLQGEPGPTGPAPGTAEIQAAVSAMSDLDVPSLAGRPATGYHDTLTWGRFFEAEAAVVTSATGTVEAEATASGGSVVRVRFDDPAGVAMSVSSTDLGEPIAETLVDLEFRLQVLGNTDPDSIAVIYCDATRAGESSPARIASFSIAPTYFDAAETWQLFPLRCSFLPDDIDQAIGVEYIDQISALMIDSVRLVPEMARQFAQVRGEMNLVSPTNGIYGLSLIRTDEEDRQHTWKFWNMNEDYGRNALEIWEYRQDSTGASCGGNPGDGAMCNRRFVIGEGGNVGIGVGAPSHLLQLSNGAYNATGAWVDGSSITYKTDVTPLAVDEALSTLDGLEPVSFRYRGDPTDPRVGFIAEEVPELVATADRKGVSAMEIAATLTKVVQHQRQELRSLKHQNVELRSRARTLEERLEHLERRLEQ